MTWPHLRHPRPPDSGCHPLRPATPPPHTAAHHTPRPTPAVSAPQRLPGVRLSGSRRPGAPTPNGYGGSAVVRVCTHASHMHENAQRLVTGDPCRRTPGQSRPPRMEACPRAHWLPRSACPTAGPWALCRPLPPPLLPSRTGETRLKPDRSIMALLQRRMQTGSALHAAVVK